jgi:hypothetical protein
VYLLVFLRRAVADGAESAAMQQALQRLVVLLVVQHLARLDQASTAPSTSSSIHPAAGGTDQRAVACPGTATSSSSSTPRLPAFLSSIAAAVAGIRNDCSSGALEPGCASGWVDRLPEFWHVLRSETDEYFSEAVRQECMPVVLSGRYVTQLLSMAALGQDPVQLGHPLHVDGARAELSQLLVDMQLQQQQQRGFLQQSHQSQYSSTCRTGCSSATTQGVHQHLHSGCTSSCSSSCSRSAAGCDGCDIRSSSSSSADAGRLLQCSSWVATAHKLMWHLELAGAGHCQTTDTVKPHPGSAEAALHAQTAHGWPYGTPVQSVAALSGPSTSCLAAAAVTAAAATGCSVVDCSLAELTAKGGKLLWELLQDARVSPAAASNTAAGGAASTFNPAAADAADLAQATGQDMQQASQQAAGSPQSLVVLVNTTTEGSRDLGHRALSALQQLCTGMSLVGAPTAQQGNTWDAEPPCQQQMPQVNLILLCAPSQCPSLHSAMGPRCFKLALPGAPTREQLEEDCRVQLAQDCSKHLSDHLQDLGQYTKQYREALQTAVQENSGPPLPQEQGQGLLSQGQQQQSCTTHGPAPSATAGAALQHALQGPAGAAPAAPSVGRLAERLSGALAAIHMTAVEAYTPLYSSNIAATNDAQPLWTAHDRVCQAVLLSKPADVVRALQQLLLALRQPLLNHRSALKAALKGAQRHMTPGEALAAAATGAVPRAAAGDVAAAAGAGNAAGRTALRVAAEPGALQGRVRKCVANWTQELLQVCCCDQLYSVLGVGRVSLLLNHNTRHLGCTFCNSVLNQNMSNSHSSPLSKYNLKLTYAWCVAG